MTGMSTPPMLPGRNPDPSVLVKSVVAGLKYRHNIILGMTLPVMSDSGSSARYHTGMPRLPSDLLQRLHRRRLRSIITERPNPPRLRPESVLDDARRRSINDRRRALSLISFILLSCSSFFSLPLWRQYAVFASEKNIGSIIIRLCAYGKKPAGKYNRASFLKPFSLICLILWNCL